MGIKNDLDDAYVELFENREPVDLEYIDIYYRENNGILLEYEDGLLGIHSDESINAIAFTIFDVDDENNTGCVDESITTRVTDRFETDLVRILDDAKEDSHKKILRSLRSKVSSSNDDDDDGDETYKYIG